MKNRTVTLPALFAESGFPVTRWTEVRDAANSASPTSASSLEAVCRRYWLPLYAYTRARGLQPEAAADTTQDFFCHILTHGVLCRADPACGRLRDLLRKALAEFIIDQRRYACRQCRDGGKQHVPIDSVGAEELLRAAAPFMGSGDAIHSSDMLWARAVLGTCLQKLRDEAAARNQAGRLEAIIGWIAGEQQDASLIHTAEAMGMSPESIRIYLWRTRKRFRILMRSEVMRTLCPGASPEDEMRYLLDLLTESAAGHCPVHA